MRCTVYKSLRQFDYYLYVRTADEFSRVPEGLRCMLGNMEKVIELDLHPQRTLAKADVQEVIRQIDARGYYLQMPPRPGGAPLVS